MPKLLPIYDHLPIHVKEQIIDYTNTETKLALRKVCRQNHAIISKSPIVYRQIAFSWTYNTDQITITRKIDTKPTTVRLQSRPSGVRKVVRRNAQSAESPVFLKDQKLADVAVRQLFAIFDISKNVKIEKLEIRLGCKNGHKAAILENFKLEFEKLNNRYNRQVSVRELEMKSEQNGEELYVVMANLTPKTLESIVINKPDDPFTCPCHLTNSLLYLSYSEALELTKVAQLEQWKMAKSLVLKGYNLELPWKDTEHFEEMEYCTTMLKLDDMVYILDNFLRENGWKKRVIHYVNCEHPDVADYFHLLHGDKPTNGRTFKIEKNGFACEIFVWPSICEMVIFKEGYRKYPLF